MKDWWKMFFQILSKKEYRKLQNERDEYLKRYNELKQKLKQIEKQENSLKRMVEKYKESYEQIKEKHDKLKEDYSELQEQSDATEIGKKIKELGIDKNRLEALWTDRTDLIELYIDKLYSLAKHFAQESKNKKVNRGLFVILVDSRNMVDTNFSEFHEGQKEHLMESKYKGIDNLSHLFSEQIYDIFR